MTRTLVLNASYQPLTVVSLHRAVVLVLAEKAEVVEADGELRSASSSVPAPTVIRLRRYVRVPYRRRVALTRRNVLARDNHQCAYCGKKASTIDHVHPRSRGGKHAWNNVVAACGPCNNRKDDKLLTDIGWSLPFEPSEPSGWTWLIIGIAEVDPSWEPYFPEELAAAV